MCSFSERTKVVMADGSRKPIRKIAVGDKVQARDPQTGERVGKAVLALFVHTDTLVRLKVGNETITTTVDHPFWNADASEYQRADQLERGDRVLATDGRVLEVRGLRAGSERTGTAYNFEVADIHTHQVGDAGVLVHNSCKISGGDATSGGPYRGGRSGALPTGNGIERHHMPADSISPVKRSQGPAIQMDKADHAKTASSRRSYAAQSYRREQKDLIDQGRFDDAIQMDIDDVTSKFPGRYDDAILEMIGGL